MELGNIASIFGGVAIVLWIAKEIGQRLIQRYFDLEKQNIDLRESWVKQEITWLQGSVKELKVSIDKNNSELTQTRIKMQGLSRDLETLSHEIKSTGTFQRESSQKLVDVLKNMQSQLRDHGQELEVFGKVLMKMPEQK